MPDHDRHLNELEADHLLRRLRGIDSEPGTTVTIEGQRLVLMASNNYLGLATHPALVEAAVHATTRYGVGAGAARLISGNLPPHQHLEAALADFKQTEAALAFASGYLANIGLIPALIGRGGLLLADRLCHASLFDGCRLSGADLRVFEHNDPGHLEQLLSGRRSARPSLIVTEGVFSMDGDLAPLPDLVTLAERYEAHLLVDDAHGTGVMGAAGRGTAEHFGVAGRLPFQVGTLGKALGSSGGYVVGHARMMSYLVNTARSFIYSTAPPPATAAASCAALAVVQREPERRARLWENRRALFDGLHRLGFRMTSSESPIIPVLIGDPERAVAFAHHLEAAGVFAPAIRPPTVPPGGSRIRFTVTSEHTPEQIRLVLAACESAVRRMNLL